MGKSQNTIVMVRSRFKDNSEFFEILEELFLELSVLNFGPP